MTQVLPLAKTASDHVPCVVSIGTSIPRANIFRFENFWVEQEGFMDCVKQSWNKPSDKSHISARLVQKFKTLRDILKPGSKTYPSSSCSSINALEWFIY